MSSCKLCEQFVENTIGNLFHEIFENNNLHVIYEFEFFILGVGLGQIIEGYTLLLPKRHVSSFGKLDNIEIAEYIKIKQLMVEFYSNSYNCKPILFEHGCSKFNFHSGACIQHAHLHFFPIDLDISGDLAPLLDKNFRKLENVSLEDDLSQLDVDYIYFENTSTNICTTYLGVKGVKSQLLRFILASQLNSEKWNWQVFPEIENMKRTASKFKSEKFGHTWNRCMSYS